MTGNTYLGRVTLGIMPCTGLTGHGIPLSGQCRRGRPRTALCSMRTCEDSEEAWMVKTGSQPNTLSVHRTVHVPLAEVSGVCLRRGARGRMSLIAISDRTAVAAWVVLPEDDDEEWSWSKTDIKGVEGSLIPKKDPQIEAVCADGAGRVLLLQEAPARVELLDWEAERVVATIDLDIEPGHPLREAWLDPEGSRGEGVVLLSNGHLLVAKEKDPPAFIEFGPKGDRPSGLGSDATLSGGTAWPIEQGHHTFVSLDTWLPTDQLLKACADFSDLEIGPDGRLYLLSDKSATISRLTELVPGTGMASVERTWSLGGVDGKPEGLTFTRHGRAIVALDTRGAENNLVVLDPPVVTWW